MKPIDGKRGQPGIDRRTAEEIRKAAKERAQREGKQNG